MSDPAPAGVRRPPDAARLPGQPLRRWQADDGQRLSVRYRPRGVAGVQLQEDTDWSSEALMTKGRLAGVK